MDFYQTFYLKSYSSLAIQKGEKLLDAGASIGTWTIYASLRVGEEGRVVAVEPNPVNYTKLLSNLRLNHSSNVYPLQKALWDQGGLDLRLGGTGGETRVTGKGSGEVRSETIDSLSDSLGYHFDRIKMDVEGAEARALKGAKDSLTFCRQIILEIHGRDNLETVGRILTEQGFTTRLWPAESFTQALREVFFHPALTLRSEVHNKFRTSLRVVRQLEVGLTAKILSSVKGGSAVGAKPREPYGDDFLALMMGFR